MSKLTTEQFFAAIAPTIALVWQQGSSIFPSVRLAQSLLETGGEIHAWNNLGGIKVGSGKLTPYWRGAAVTKGTWEFIEGQRIQEKAAFRAYPTLYHYYKDQDELFKNSRYSKVRQAQTAVSQAEQLQASGYATDPAYAAKLIAIMRQNKLEAYDQARQALGVEKGFEGAIIIPVMYEQVLCCSAYLEKGVTYVAVRKLCELKGAKVEWKGKEVFVNNEQVETRLAGLVSYAKPRDLMQILSIELEWDTYAKVLFVH